MKIQQYSGRNENVGGKLSTILSAKTKSSLCSRAFKNYNQRASWLRDKGFFETRRGSSWKTKRKMSASLHMKISSWVFHAVQSKQDGNILRQKEHFESFGSKKHIFETVRVFVRKKSLRNFVVIVLEEIVL